VNVARAHHDEMDWLQGAGQLGAATAEVDIPSASQWGAASWPSVKIRVVVAGSVVPSTSWAESANGDLDIARQKCD
jgi:hypothetical protein